MISADFHQKLLATFREEAREHVVALRAGAGALRAASGQDERAAAVETLFRRAHTLKGAARAVNDSDTEHTCARLEEWLAALKQQKAPPTPEMLAQIEGAVRQIRGHIESANQPHPAPPSAASPHEATDLDTTARAGSAMGAASAGSTATVRIAATRLDSVLFQAEEMVSAKLTAAHRVDDFRKLHDRIAAWGKQWQQLRKQLQRRNGGRMPPAGPESRADAEDFIDRTEQFLGDALRETFTATTAAAQDERALASMVDSLLESLKQAAMQPFSSYEDLLATMVADIAQTQRKKARFVLEGGNVEVDRRVLEEIKDALVQLLRNSLDHGIEPPDERQAHGKAPVASLRISVLQGAGGSVELSVQDDGRGVDLAAVKAVAARNGLRDAATLSSMPEEEVLGLVFESGFSTSGSVTSLSGRGLGLAIVRERVEKLGGTISLHSTPGRGVIFHIVLPNTLARFRGVGVQCGDRRYILPAAAVQRVIRARHGDISTIENRATIRVGAETIAVLNLATLLNGHGREAPDDSGGTLLVLTAARHTQVALIVDHVDGEEEVLMKQLGPQLVRIRNVLGATVQGNGEVVLVLNPSDLVRSAAAAPSARRADQGPAARHAVKKQVRNILVAEDSITSRTLIKHILQAAGYRVETAVNGAEALKCLRSGSFDLVVSDVDMPQMGGLELTARIRAHEKLTAIPVVLVTSLASREDQERGMSAGANAYIVKSDFDQSNLLDVIKRLIG